MEKQTTQEYEKAIAYIIDRIKEGSLQLGSKLPPERRIAEELGIGRNSIREAISILHGMGLIEQLCVKACRRVYPSVAYGDAGTRNDYERGNI